MDKLTAVNKIIKWWKDIQNYKNYMYGLEMCSYYEDEYDYENDLTDNSLYEDFSEYENKFNKELDFTVLDMGSSKQYKIFGAVLDEDEYTNYIKANTRDEDSLHAGQPILLIQY